MAQRSCKRLCRTRGFSTQRPSRRQSNGPFSRVGSGPTWPIFVQLTTKGSYMGHCVPARMAGAWLAV